MKRRLQVSTRLAEHSDWPGLRQVGKLERTTRTKDGETLEVCYFITSVARDRADAAALLKYDRDHWKIENRLHWVRDVALGEDHCRVRVGRAPQNLAALRNASLNLLRFAEVNEVTSTLRRFALRSDHLFKFLRRFKN